MPENMIDKPDLHVYIIIGAAGGGAFVAIVICLIAICIPCMICLCRRSQKKAFSYQPYEASVAKVGHESYAVSVST